jgi:tRNA/tmRNA/rRNA uracil-C5-methylase (TrmA/RlmC/RlmD family)
VARLEGRVVFVRHALPGERVRARVTEGGDRARYLRADAVEVLVPSADRVAPPCPSAGPGLCGGCDWQHATPAAQRDLKGQVVREQLRRLAGLDVEVTVEALPGDPDGLGWRTRVQHGVDDQGRLGYRRHRSHEVLAVAQCPISHPDLAAVGHLDLRWPRVSRVDVAVAPSTGERLVVVTPSSAASRRPSLPDVTASVAVTGPATAQGGAGRQRAVGEGSEESERPADGLTRVRGRTWLRETVVAGEWRRDFRVTGAGFWQVHPAAAATFVAAVLAQLDPQPGERALDLYSGVGLFAAALADRVGPAGAVATIEGDLRAVADARRNLHELPGVSLRQGSVAGLLAAALGDLPGGRADVVVLDPPRAGAGRAIVERLCAAGPRAISYVACDPAALARDVAIAGEHGYRLAAIRSFDAFPMTHHIECVALLIPLG